MAWTVLSFNVNDILTAAKMTSLYDNFAAMAQRDTGAPVIRGTIHGFATVRDNDGASASTDGSGLVDVMSMGDVSRPQSCSLWVEFTSFFTNPGDAVTTFNSMWLRVKHNGTYISSVNINSHTGVSCNLCTFTWQEIIPLTSADSGDLYFTLAYSYEASPGTAQTGWQRMRASYKVIQN